ncbi:MAG: hypothetical protein RMJ48_17990 [Roseiflexaceae bacterium]|nr:hypothetical protein [Roseiflexaceae bacterium]
MYLGFENPHWGAFKVRILRESWKNFAVTPETQYRVGQRVQATRVIGWYQGDPAIIVETPEQIVVKGE